jgi:hypothetical protein
MSLGFCRNVSPGSKAETMTAVRSATVLAAAACLAVLAAGCASHGTRQGRATNGTPLVMAPGNGDQSYPWRVSFHPYPNT